MRKISAFSTLILTLALGLSANAASKRPAPKAKGRPASSSGSAAASSNNGRDARVERALQLARNNQFQEASRLLYQLSLMPEYQPRASQLNYILGQMMSEMGMDQISAMFYFKVITKEGKANANSRFVRQSLERLAIAADKLESDVLLKYTVNKVSEEEFPSTSRDMLYYRQGEVKLDEKQPQEAAKLFSKIRQGSIYYHRAQYRLGLSLAMSGDLERAQSVFERLAAQSVEGGITDRNRVNSLLGKARVLYQAKNWEGSMAAYREIPRDTEQWHEALFESSWAMLQAGQFRSALSNFHSLHSAYYDDFFQPESLYLRGLVYLYICRYDELATTLEIFDRIYKPVFRIMKNFSNAPVESFYRELAKVQNNFDILKGNKVVRKNLALPFFVTRSILKEGDVKRGMHYVHRLEEEKRRIETQPAVWRASGIGRAARAAIDKRIEATRQDIGRMAKNHMNKMVADLDDINQQVGFLQIEMISGKKEVVKKELVGKGYEQRVDDDTDRSYFVQNGYDYWPFQGEYWLDEIGNYQYVGVRACD